jgi:hypothetical protein
MIVVVENEREREVYQVGHAGVTKIEATVKSGEYSHIPYIRVWKGEFAHSEFCQHGLVGVYFEPAALPPDPEERMPF